MLEEHRFYTDYAKDLLNERKEKNMKKLQKKTAEEEKQEDEVTTLAGLGKIKAG